MHPPAGYGVPPPPPLPPHERSVSASLSQVLDECLYRGFSQSLEQEGLFAEGDVPLDVNRGRMYKVRLPNRVPRLITKPVSFNQGEY